MCGIQFLVVQPKMLLQQIEAQLYTILVSFTTRLPPDLTAWFISVVQTSHCRYIRWQIKLTIYLHDPPPLLRQVFFGRSMLKCLGTCTVWQKQHSARWEFPVKPQWQLDQLTLSIEQIECTAGLWAVYILNVLMLYSQWIQRKNEKTTLYQHSKFNQQTTCMSLRDWYLGQEWECEITLVLQFDNFPVDVALCQAFYSETLESLSSMSQTCEELHVMIILNIKVCSSVGRFLGCPDQIQGIIWDEALTFAPSRSEDQMLVKTLMSHFSAAIPACCPMLDAQEVILSHSTSASICVVRCWLDVPITMVKKLFTCCLLSVRKTGTLDRLQICTTMCRSSLLYFQCFWNRKRMVVAANLFPEQIALVKAEVACFLYTQSTNPEL